MGALEGKVAVITGGNSGIGLATARRFVKEGAYVFITGRREEELEKAVSLIEKNVTAVQGDVSKLDDLDHLYDVVRKAKGHIDIVFANAGVVDPVSLTNSTPESYDKHFNLNARGSTSRCRRHSRCSPTKPQSSFLDQPHGRWAFRAMALIQQRKQRWFPLSVAGPQSCPTVAFAQT